MIGPVLLGAAWLMLAVLILGLLCFREFSRATGLFRERGINQSAADKCSRPSPQEMEAEKRPKTEASRTHGYSIEKQKT